MGLGGPQTMLLYGVCSTGLTSNGTRLMPFENLKTFNNTPADGEKKKKKKFFVINFFFLFDWMFSVPNGDPGLRYCWI